MAKAGQGKHKQVFGKTIVTAPGRLVFPSIDAPSALEGQDKKKYQASLVQKPEHADPLIKEIEEVGAKAFGAAWSSTEKTSDGREKRSLYFRPYATGEQVIAKIREKAADRAEEHNEEPKEVSENVIKLYTGKVRIVARGDEKKNPPDCYTINKEKMLRRPGNEDDARNIKELFYPGCYAQLCVTPFSYVFGDKKGVGLIFKGIKFAKDGDRLDTIDVGAAFEAASGAFDDESFWSEEEESEAGAAFNNEEEDEAPPAKAATGKATATKPAAASPGKGLGGINI